MSNHRGLDKFRNRVFQEDILALLRKLPDNSVDMVYGDPDYNVGISYAGVRYTKRWNEYITWYVALTKECMRVLKPSGNLFMMNYPKQNAHLRTLYLDGAACEVRDYAWVYHCNIGHSSRRFTTAHRSILHATKSRHNDFYKEQVALPYLNPGDRRIKARIAAGHKGRMPYDWFFFNLVKNRSREKTGHPCQIPVALAEMLLRASTKEGDDCLILFGGSGNELRACRRLGRNFISAELHPDYYAYLQEQLASTASSTSLRRALRL